MCAYQNINEYLLCGRHQLNKRSERKLNQWICLHCGKAVTGA